MQWSSYGMYICVMHSKVVGGLTYNFVAEAEFDVE